MSLVAHWKLDGDTKDPVGGNNGSGSPTYVDGKIGQGIDGDGSQIRVSSDSESIKSAFTGNQMTLSVWLRQYDHNTYRWDDILGMDGTRLERGRGDDGNPNGDYWCNLGTGDSAISGRENNVFNSDIGLPGNEWFHLLIRRSGDDYAVYINGERDSSCPVTGPMDISGDFVINEAAAGAEIDDVRLYDHAISEKKIKQLSRAKVLHYTFDGDPQNNLAYEWYDTQSLYNSNSHPNSESEFDNFFDDSRSDVSLGGKGKHNKIINWGSSGQGTEIDSAGPKPQYLPGGGFSWKVEGMIRVPETGTYTFGIDGDDACDIFVDNTNVADFYGGHGFDGNYGHNGTITLEKDTYYEFKVRMEEGGGGDGVSAAWQTPSSSTWEYVPTEYFYSKEIVSDASGYGNTGEVIRNPTITTDTPIGRRAIDFQSGKNCIKINSAPDFSGPNELTISVWVKSNQSSWQNTGTFVSRRNNDQFVLHPDGGASSVDWYVHTDENGWQKVSHTVDDIQSWNHYVLTYTDGELKAYLNGDVVGTRGVGNTLASSSSPITVGRDDDGDKNYGNERMSDLRLYASALSDDEVKDIYEQRASIDSGGNFHSHELLDTPSSEQIADENEWELGTSGSQGSFSQNGSTSENDIVEYPDPFGNIVPTWRCSPDSNDNGDGGWNMNFQGDNSDRLRFSVFVNRTGDSMNGNYYHGCDNGGNTLNLDGSTNGNPYFHSGSLPETNQWYLLVGILHPNSYSGGQGEVTGVYDMNGKKLSGGTDYKWGTGSRQEMRDYLYYSTDTSERQYFVYPRIDVVDGSEPDIASLVNGLDSRTNNQRDMNVTTEGTLEAGLSEVGPGAESLVGWWPLDGDTRDYAGSANGTNNGASVTSGLGQSAYDFERSNNNEISLSDLGINGNVSLSLTVWHKLDSNQSHNRDNFFGFGGHSGNDSFSLRYNSDTQLRHYFYGNDLVVSVPNMIGDWHFSSVIYDSQSNTRKIYFDGSLVGSDSPESGINMLNEQYSIGGFNNEHFGGKIQDVRLYDRALTTEEVETLYNLTDPRQNQQVVQTDNGLVHTKHEYDERL